jgi:hypothetical protein
MAAEREAMTQLARLLQDGSLRTAEPDSLSRAVESRFDFLVDGLLEEAASSDDVSDAATARAFLDERIAFLGPLLPPEQRTRLSQALDDKIDAW